MRRLTTKQSELLDYTHRHVVLNGYQPSRAEMARRFGVTVSAMQQRIDLMVRKGAIEVVGPRAIRILHTDYSFT